MQVLHPIAPVYNENSKILILGSFPSVKSRETGFFYGHPQNRFWRVLSAVLDSSLALDSIDSKRKFLLDNNIALWDVIASCEIKGSSDSSITNVIPNDLSEILSKSSITAIYCNGAKAYSLYEKYMHSSVAALKTVNPNAVLLPSTSPANAACSINALVTAYSRIKIALNRSNPLSSYYSLNNFARDFYHKKLYRLSLDGGFTCPNRDGKISYGGCIFCDGSGSGDFTGNKRAVDAITMLPENTNSSCEYSAAIIENSKTCKGFTSHIENGISGRLITPIENQLIAQKKLIEKKLSKSTENGYIAYLQSFTGTYGPVEQLRKLYMKLADDPSIDIISIATRPDCLDDDVLKLLGEMNARKPVWIELGLQSIHPKTATYIRRGYDLKCYDQAIKKLYEAGISHIIVHLILGLPGETLPMMKKSLQYVIKSGAGGVKLQLLHVLKDTDLDLEYQKGMFECLTMEEYLDILSELVSMLPPDTVVHRLTGDGNKAILRAPLWSCDKKRVLNEINKRL